MPSSPARSLVRSLPPELVQEFDSDELRSLMKAFVKFANQIRSAPLQPESGEEHGFGEDDAEGEAAEGEASVSGGGGEQSMAGTSMTKAGLADASVEVRELGSLFGTLALGSDTRAQLEILESIVAAAADARAPVGFGDFLALLVHVRAEGARVADARRRTVTDALWDVVVSSLPLAVAGVSEHKARARAPALRSPAAALGGPKKTGAKPKLRAPPAGGIAATADLEESDDDLGSSDDDDDAPALGVGPAGTRAKVAAAERQARRARVALKEGEAARAAAHETRAAIDGFEERAAQARAHERAAKAASAHQAAARKHAKAVRRANERGEPAPPPPRAAIAPDDDDGAAESDDEDELLKGSAGGSNDASGGGVHSASAKDSRAGAIAALGLHWSTEAPRLAELAAARPERVWRRADVMRALRVLSVPALGVTALGGGVACESLATLERLDVSHNKLVSLALGGGDDGVDEAAATTMGGRDSPPRNAIAGLKVLHAYGNEITSLHDMPELPAALMLGLGFNLIQSVSLPLELGTRLAPALCALDLAYNSMCDLDAALHALAGGRLPSQLRQLHLLGNPCALAPRYRSRVLYVLPSLKLLDDLDVTDTEALVAQRARAPPAAPRTVSIGVALSALRAIPFAPANTPPANAAPASKAGGGAKDAKATKGKGKGKDDKPKPGAAAPAPLVDDGSGPRMFVEARVLGAGVEETVTTARVAWSADFVAAAAAADAAVAAAAAAAADQGAAPAPAVVPAARAELQLRPTVPLRDGVRFDGLLLTLIKVTPAEPASADAPAVTDAEGGTDAPPPEPTAETQTIVGAVRVRLTPLLEPSMNARRAADGVLHERAVLEISPEFVEAERAGLAAAADAAAADDSAANAPLPPTEVALSISLNADDAVERSLAGEAVDHARLNLEAGVGIAELSVPLSASASRSVVSGV